MDQYIDISIREIGLSIVNDLTHQELVYLTINKSKEMWTETQKSVVKPLSGRLNHRLEKKYRVHMKSNESEMERKTYNIGRHRVRTIRTEEKHTWDTNLLFSVLHSWETRLILLIKTINGYEFNGNLLMDYDFDVVGQ